MRRSYEFKQEDKYVHEQRGWGTTTYPSSYGGYHVPPPNMQKKVHTPIPSSFHYDSSSDDDHQHMVVNDNHWNHYGYKDGNRGWCGTRQADDMRKNKPHIILRPPLGTLTRHPSHQHQNYERGYNEASRIKNNNRVMEDSRKFPYGEVSRLDEDDYDRYGGIDDPELESLIKGMRGGGMVKKIEVIEIERRSYRGAGQEWKVLGGNDTLNNYHTYNNYPNTKAPWVKGF